MVDKQGDLSSPIRPSSCSAAIIWYPVPTTEAAIALFRMPSNFVPALSDKIFSPDPFILSLNWKTTSPLVSTYGKAMRRTTVVGGQGGVGEKSRSRMISPVTHWVAYGNDFRHPTSMQPFEEPKILCKAQPRPAEIIYGVK